MELKVINENFSVCKITDLQDVDFTDEFFFLSGTDEELSLVCRTQSVPRSTIEAEHGWKGFRVQGVLDFSLIGILSKISSLLADNEISIFAVSTYNTDYILIKEDKFEAALAILEKNGYQIINN